MSKSIKENGIFFTLINLFLNLSQTAKLRWQLYIYSFCKQIEGMPFLICKMFTTLASVVCVRVRMFN